MYLTETIFFAMLFLESEEYNNEMDQARVCETGFAH